MCEEANFERVKSCFFCCCCWCWCCCGMKELLSLIYAELAAFFSHLLCRRGFSLCVMRKTRPVLNCTSPFMGCSFFFHTPRSTTRRVCVRAFDFDVKNLSQSSRKYVKCDGEEINIAWAMIDRVDWMEKKLSNTL